MQSTTRFRSKRTTARQLASLAVIAAAAMLPVSAAYAAKKPPLVVTEGIKAYRLCTGSDKLSHVIEGSIDQQAMTLALRMRAALLQASVEDDWEAWALALAERTRDHQAGSTPALGAITASRMRLLDEFIDAGLDGPLGVQAMADLLGLSEGYFIRAFKHAAGKSPHSYLIDRRLAKARALMRDSTATLAEIAHTCGFNSQAHMTTTFRQRLGVSPVQLRR